MQFKKNSWEIKVGQLKIPFASVKVIIKANILFDWFRIIDAIENSLFHMSQIGRNLWTSVRSKTLHPQHVRGLILVANAFQGTIICPVDLAS